MLVYVFERRDKECKTKSELRVWDSECVCTCSLSLHLAHSSLDDGIKASLWGISVSGHHLLFHFLCEAAHLLRQRQNMFVAKLGQAGGVNAVNETEFNWSGLSRAAVSLFIHLNICLHVKLNTFRLNEFTCLKMYSNVQMWMQISKNTCVAIFLYFSLDQSGQTQRCPL